MDILANYFQKSIEKYPELLQMSDAVKSLPEISSWIAERPPLQPFEAKF